MRVELTEVGIEVVSDLPCGTHYCLFYETRRDLLDVLAPFFKAGLERGEFCLWVLSDLLTEDEAWDVLRQAIPELDTHRTRQNIEIVPGSVWHAPGSSFDPKTFCDRLSVKQDEALARGYTGLRSTGDKRITDKEEWSVFRRYEDHVDSCVVGSRMVLLCTYQLEQCGAAELLDVVQSHQQVATMRGGTFGFLESPELKITRKKIEEYEKRLRSLASEVVLAEERERKRLAGVLHDSVAQDLIASKLRAESLAGTVSQPEVAEELQAIIQTVSRIITDTRSLMYEISHPILYMLGLEAATGWLVQKMQDEHDIRGNFSTDSQPKPLDEGVSVLLFSAVQELISNIIKHAHADEVTVRISRAGDTVEIVVEDQGVGFDVSRNGTHYDKTGGFGLFSVRERLNNLGGEFRIVSAIGHGTTVTLIAPITATGPPSRSG